MPTPNSTSENFESSLIGCVSSYPSLPYTPFEYLTGAGIQEHCTVVVVHILWLTCTVALYSTVRSLRKNSQILPVRKGN